ncbi:sensor domain-containing phosphodiesterase [Modestobacter versicolor]|uniref:Diguanylate phosphsdiesterase n=1 Tax=Modestobacter versicolor TaxID=429133 RepID=A0A323V8L0_9ACTN|nr:EAL domain-containing protein [Modestobacter versicolor]MBB3677195.1 EAL domain-containing protein (putative c-di-GMP-specific phosphodiesterase class I) [Modestobacter versicolor]PZA21167.1 diguanylate phosphsdiesterase [Modestobacter versicolor]
MRRKRSATEQQIADLLQTARKSLGLSVAFFSRLDGTTQHLEVVESSMPLVFKDGLTQPQDTSFCQAVMDGDLPAVMPDVRDFPAAMKLRPARVPRIRSYVTAPVTLSDGSVYGSFCAFGLRSDPELSARDQALMEVLANAASVIIEPDLRDRQQHDEIEQRLRPIMARGGPDVVLQPVVDLASGARVGAEALSRFPGEWGMAPDAVFAEAHSIGAGDRLELLALQQAAAHLDTVPGYIAMNVSPATLLTRDCLDLLASLPLRRVVLELSEHDQVADYDALHAVVLPLRAQGMTLAIDDVGAGFSSLRHIVVTNPDVIKIDRSIVSGLDHDPVLARLVESLVEFAHGCGVRVVAEGVETAAEHAMLRTLQVDFGQGWLFGRPGPADVLDAQRALAG